MTVSMFVFLKLECHKYETESKKNILSSKTKNIKLFQSSPKKPTKPDTYSDI